jgi:anti-sigma factor RsiW
MPTDSGQRQIAGVWCGEVLERLPDYVDGALDPAEVARVEAHLAGCDWCERFGGSYGDLVRALRARRDPSPAGLADRLAKRLAGRLS